MLAREGCEHLPELKKLVLSCDASVLQDFPMETGQITKKLMKNWWTKHGLLYYMQKIKEENRVSSDKLSLRVNLCMSLSNYLLFTSPKVTKALEVMASMRASKLLVMAHRRRLLRGGPPLLRWQGVMPKWRRTYRGRLL
jgi:hypothetical protein